MRMLCGPQVTGISPTMRGTYIIDQNGNYHLDLASKVIATKTNLTITIRPDANWNWGGKKIPVTNKDLVYTWQQIVDPKNNNASTTGYDQIDSYKLVGSKTVVFHWKTPFADYRDLFGLVLPSQALAGLDFNKFWSDCVCGNDGKPVSDGPFMLTNYTRGQGSTLKANPDWYGKKPGLEELDFKVITDTNSEIQAMRGGEVDAIYPSPQTALAQLKGQAGLTYSSIPGFTQEHVDIQVGPKGNPLLKQPWMRQAITLGINRHSLIVALYGHDRAGPEAAEQPRVRDRHERDPALREVERGSRQGARAPEGALHRRPVRAHPQQHRDLDLQRPEGGVPLGNDGRQPAPRDECRDLLAAARCDRHQAERAASSRPTRTSSGSGSRAATSTWPSTPGRAARIRRASTPSTRPAAARTTRSYSNKQVDALIKLGDSELNPTKRTAEYQKAAEIMANDIAVIPLYAPPNILVYKSAIKGMENSNNPTQEGPTWNVEQWHW